jgi:hypothetical protein
MGDNWLNIVVKSFCCLNLHVTGIELCCQSFVLLILGNYDMKRKSRRREIKNHHDANTLIIPFLPLTLHFDLVIYYLLFMADLPNDTLYEILRISEYSLVFLTVGDIERMILWY